MELLHKSFTGQPIEVKADGESDVLHIKAYACVFGNVDSWGDIIQPGACDAFLASANADRMRLCYQHNQSEVIGVITAKGVDAIGMWFEADVLPTSTGKDVQTLLRAGALDEFSIGYYADEYHYEKRDGYRNEIRILDAITIVEVSPVTRAANEKAVILDMKNEGNENEPEVEQVEEQQPEPEAEHTNEEETENPIKQENMEDIKKQLEAVEQKAAATETALQAKEAEINNLDASIKAQEATIAELRKMIQEQPKTFRKAMREALDAHRETIEGFIKGTGRYTVEFKVASPDGSAFGSVLDNNVHATPILGNAFLLAFRNVQANGNKIAWIEGTTSKNVGYVAELAAASKTDVTFVEQTRALAKVATYMEISSDVEAWYEMLYDFCVAEGQRIIMKDVDAKVWAGAGSSSKPKEIWGIKGSATAFSALGSYANPNVGDVILDAIAQVQKAGYRADVAIVSYKTLASLRGVKDNTGNYLYNQLTGMFGQVQVYPSDQLSDTEVLVADSFCAEIVIAPLYELEFSRQASTDSWRVDLRRHVQVKVPTAKKTGIVYASSIANAITAITKA